MSLHGGVGPGTDLLLGGAYRPPWLSSRCHDRWVAEISGSVGIYRVYAWSSGIPVPGPDGEVRATWELEELTAEHTEELTQITEELTQSTEDPLLKLRHF